MHFYPPFLFSNTGFRPFYTRGRKAGYGQTTGFHTDALFSFDLELFLLTLTHQRDMNV